ncbi:MAG: hypothetical protein ACRDS0_35945 [Pseudonocardiaceae bacterium]
MASGDRTTAMLTPGKGVQALQAPPNAPSDCPDEQGPARLVWQCCEGGSGIIATASTLRSLRALPILG